MNENPLLDVALRYAELGYPVLACLPNEKRPATEHGLKDATTDAASIRKMFAETPGANLAICTAGLFVVNVDGPWLADQPERLLESAAAPMAQTPRGGRHYYFRRPAGVNWRTRANSLAPKIDVRTDGGYVLASPSVIDGVSYQWLNDGLDCSPDKLPDPPAWLAELADAAERKSEPKAAPSAPSVADGIIPEGQRDQTLTSIAGTLRRPGLSCEAMAAALHVVNRERCRPPLANQQVEKIARSIALKPADPAALPAIPVQYQRITSAELDHGNFALEYIVEGTLIAGQPCIMAGAQKTLKTNLLIDLAISVASGKPFLGALRVLRPVPTAMMSGESGLATIQETARRICDAKGLPLDEVDQMIWSPDLPRLSDAVHEPALESFLRRDAIEVVILDPAYLILPGADAANLMIQGAMLRRLSDVCQRCGAAMILCHHTKKGVADPWQPPELGDIAWAGFQEFARQWILVGRREKFEPGTGNHRLWLNVGGSAGHSSLWALDVAEGAYDGVTPRHWGVTLAKAAEARRDEHERKAAGKKQRQDEERRAKLDADKEAVKRAAGRGPDTAKGLEDASGVHNARLDAALADLLRDGSLVPTEIKKANGQTYQAYRLKSDAPEPHRNALKRNAAEQCENCVSV